VGAADGDGDEEHDRENRNELAYHDILLLDARPDAGRSL
jgi:hypothetical protein